MRHWRLTGLVVLGLVLYGAALLATMPIAVAWPWIEARVPFTVHEPQGTLWDGRAAAVTRGDARIDTVTWSLHPASLLTLGLSGRVAGDLPDGRAETGFRVGLGNHVELTELRLDTGIDRLLTWAGRGAFTGLAEGRISAIMRELALTDARPVHADGLVTWENAGVGPPGRIPLGDIALRLTGAEAGGIRGRLSSEEGPLRLSGTISVAPEGGISGELILEPRNPGDPAAARVARALGLADHDGRNVVTVSGGLSEGIDVRQRR